MSPNIIWRALGLLFFVNLLVSTDSVWAHGSLAAPTQCRVAFPTSIEATRFTQQNQDRWMAIESSRLRAQTVVRETIRELIDRSEMDQLRKADFWREMVRLMRSDLGIRFMSVEFRGIDGSILFQGAKNGNAFVIGPNGELYRGQLSEKLNRKQRPAPLWEADYTGFKLLNPPRELEVVTH